MQSLEVVVYFSLKRVYASFCDIRLTSHSMSRISSYEITEFLERLTRAHLLQKTLQLDLKQQEFYCFNPLLFLEDEFLTGMSLQWKTLLLS